MKNHETAIPIPLPLLLDLGIALDIGAKVNMGEMKW
jgi:hypothetical protein